MTGATPETARAVAQVLRMAKILDDRMGQPDKARISAWADQVQRHKLTESDLMDGLQAYYDGPSSRAIGIGDLIAHAKTARVVRIGKEDRAEREARQAELDKIKPAPDDAATIVAGFISGPTPNRTDRLRAAEDALQSCVDKASAQAAIREYFAAKVESKRAGKRWAGTRDCCPPASTQSDEHPDPHRSIHPDPKNPLGNHTMTQQSPSLIDANAQTFRGTTGCGRCDARWTGLNTAHCPACHRTFTSPSAFDQHRSGSHSQGSRHCVHPAKVGLVRAVRAYPCWGWPANEARHAQFRADATTTQEDA